MQAIALAFVKPLLEAFFNAFGRAVNDWLAGLRAEKAQREAGASEAIIAGRKQEDDALARTQAAMDEADKKPIEYRD